MVESDDMSRYEQFREVLPEDISGEAEQRWVRTLRSYYPIPQNVDLKALIKEYDGISFDGAHALQVEFDDSEPVRIRAFNTASFEESQPYERSGQWSWSRANSLISGPDSRNRLWEVAQRTQEEYIYWKNTEVRHPGVDFRSWKAEEIEGTGEPITQRAILANKIYKDLDTKGRTDPIAHLTGEFDYDPKTVEVVYRQTRDARQEDKETTFVNIVTQQDPQEVGYPTSINQLSRMVGINVITARSYLERFGLQDAWRTAVEKAKRIEIPQNGEMAELIGILAGGSSVIGKVGGVGEFHAKGIRVQTSDKLLAKRIEDLGKKIRNVDPLVKTRGDATVVSFFRKELMDDLGDFTGDEWTQTVPNKHGWVLERFPDEFLRGYLRTVGHLRVHPERSPQWAVKTTSDRVASFLSDTILPRIDVTSASQTTEGDNRIILVSKGADVQRIVLCMDLQDKQYIAYKKYLQEKQEN